MILDIALDVNLVDDCSVNNQHLEGGSITKGEPILR